MGHNMTLLRSMQRTPTRFNCSFVWVSKADFCPFLSLALLFLCFLCSSNVDIEGGNKKIQPCEESLREETELRNNTMMSWYPCSNCFLWQAESPLVMLLTIINSPSPGQHIRISICNLENAITYYPLVIS